MELFHYPDLPIGEVIRVTPELMEHLQSEESTYEPAVRFRKRMESHVDASYHFQTGFLDTLVLVIQTKHPYRNTYHFHHVREGQCLLFHPWGSLEVMSAEQFRLAFGD